MASLTNSFSNFTFKIDNKTRKEYSVLCEELGLTMSSATLALIKQAVRSQTMTFSTKDENGFTEKEAKQLEKRIRELESGKVVKNNLIEE